MVTKFFKDEIKYITIKYFIPNKKQLKILSKKVNDKLDLHINNNRGNKDFCKSIITGIILISFAVIIMVIDKLYIT